MRNVDSLPCPHSLCLSSIHSLKKKKKKLKKNIWWKFLFIFRQVSDLLISFSLYFIHSGRKMGQNLNKNGEINSLA